MKNGYRRMAKGFTLLELAVVSAILVILLAIVAPAVSITQPNAVANHMWRFTEAASENYLTLMAAAQLDPVEPAKILAPGKPVLDMLAYGVFSVAPAYQGIYNATGVKPLSHLVGLNAESTLYVLTSSPGISVSFSYTSKLIYMTFSNTPFEVTQALADRLQPGHVLNPGTSNYPVGNLMRYTCGASVNYCNVDLIHWIPD